MKNAQYSFWNNNIFFVVAEITLRMAMITSSVVKITFENGSRECKSNNKHIPYKVNMSEKSCWYSLRKRWKLFKWRDKIQS